MPDIGMTGGERLGSYLADAARRVGTNPTVSVGFLEGATYPDGTSVPLVAAIQEFGGRIEREPSETTIFRKVNKAQTGYLRKGRFVKAKQSNFASTHYVGAYVITIPPRPYFRNMIAENKGGWSDSLGAKLKTTDMNVEKSLGLMGDEIKGQLQASINSFIDPPNAKSTIAKKGFDKPLVDSNDMMNAVDYRVTE